MTENTSCETSALLLLETWEGEKKKSHLLFTEWDEKCNNMNTQDKTFEVWIKIGGGGRGWKFTTFLCWVIHPQYFCVFIKCQQSQSRQQSVIKLAIPKNHFL